MPDFNLSQKEKEILELWRKNKVFEKSLKQNQRNKTFIFFEGPPTANGRPGLHHVEARSFKDIILRFRSMQGYFVPRRAGWDTQGLPVEVEVEKALGLKSKLEIEEYGVAKFNQKAKESVWVYKDLWEKMTQRLGFWLDMDDAYVTYEPKYLETLFWVIKQFYNKGFLQEDFKVFPHCPRCATTLSSHEMNQPGAYRLTKDDSVYIKFKLKPGQKIGDEFKTDDKTYILSWTTTPWTLPGNVALAVGRKIDYVLTKYNGDNLILARARLNQIFKESSTVDKKFKGKDLVSLEYEPLFDIESLKSAASYKVYPANFVTTQDGTGVVHTAVMYGDDDYKLGTKVGLPKHHTVGEAGRFTKEVKGFAGSAAKPKDENEQKQINQKIFGYLKSRGNFLFAESYEHEYPFCWRCDTPLIYYAKKGWVMKTSKMKKELLKNNQKINWLPEWVKENRFGNWLKEGKDWNFSRSRYWGTPLPIWQCQKCQAKEVLGSFQELAERNPAKNKYILMRHGGAISNQKDIVCSWPEPFQNPLTEKGRKQILLATKRLKKLKPDLIISSDLLRTKMTSEILAKELGLKVIYDSRLREILTGRFNNGPVKVYQKFMGQGSARYFKKSQDGESLEDLKLRTMALVLELEKKYQGKTILFVSHEDPMWALASAMQGIEEKEVYRQKTLRNAEFKEVELLNLPRNEKFELDPHRPFIDQIIFECKKCAGSMKRAPEVCDVWFDSGAMPFAQSHYPFENKDLIDQKKFFPADYITEAMDQTRGWFYTLLAVATLLQKGIPFKNVVVLGLVLDKHGKKMSKSKGNVVEPVALMEKYSADTVRWYFYTINQPAEVKRFDEQDLVKIQRNFFLILANILNFYKTYKPNKIVKTSKKNLIEKWFNSRLQETANKVVKNLENYEIVDSARGLQNLLDDFSRWYLRRSRSVFQRPKSKAELNQAAYNLANFILEFAKLLAPFAPFISDYLFQEVKNDLKNKNLSIHLDNYPKIKPLGKLDLKIIKLMALVRELASKAIEKRGVKIRQPLNELRIRNSELRNKKEFLEILKDELNVKNINFDSRIKENLIFDAKITAELKDEGILRELIRGLQALRAEFNLKPQDKAVIWFRATEEFGKFIEQYKNFLLKQVNLKEVGFKGNLVGARKIELETFGPIDVLIKKL